MKITDKKTNSPADELGVKPDAAKAAAPSSYKTALAWLALAALLGLLWLGLSRRSEAGLAIGDPAPDFVLTTFDGQTIDSRDLAGKVVVLNFWASWCVTCKDEAVELEMSSRAYADQGVVFLGVDYVDTEPEALGYLETYGITYPNGPDLRTRISQAYRIRGVPETFIIDAAGKLAYFKAGPFASLEEINRAVEIALQR